MNQPEVTEEPTVLQAEADHFKKVFTEVRSEVGRMIIGQERVVESTLYALFCGGNVLLEGVPGLGKTELVKALSKVLELEFQRIQFTPDLMPADIIGTNIMNTDETGTYRFEFRKGPIFTQLLLADEINRASPKTQSALLETMQEGTVTAAGTQYRLDQPFFVLATQNPIEQEGTYPLPEAQLDRFLFKVNVPFPNRAELNTIVQQTILRQPVELKKLLDSKQILELRNLLEKVVVVEPIRDYAIRLVLSTHPGTDFATEEVRRFIHWGASPRAAQSLIKSARVRALSEGRAHVAFEDIRYFANEVLQHRVLLNYDGQAENINVTDLIEQNCKELPEKE
ncbi:AAA family ATPase [Gimesia aquarii]|uniref:ATPase family associated with various cellular activities (AAA) n=1 Tax=Gimesia aquarii TaxID=2527964 RepID=A0A517X0Q4_9PLAN|nr:MoxR family ATPase [Gimesia aquarii]QDU11081.1 ATPase family associated with various cellular activities (AAA) [Gimesia aquarii]